MLARAKRPPKQNTTSDVSLPAPIGGLNAVDVVSAMPALDCLMLWNMLASELGLRTRMGYREWCTNLTGGLDNRVRCIIPFAGSAANGANNKLFATTETGIWDVSASSAAPPQLVTFPTSIENSGFGSSHTFTTFAGHFLMHCDEEHGLYMWSETSASWTKIPAGTRAPWAANTAVVVGVRCVNDDGKVYECDVAGVTAASGGPTGTGTNITDGTAQWDYVGVEDTTAIGPSLADQVASQGLYQAIDPANFVHVTAWKNRLFFTERDSARGWYLDINAIRGVATSFNFGTKFRGGGHLVGLYNWSYDGGSGIDTRLVAVSGAADVAIYDGTDPSSINTFGLKGCWSVGAIPVGRGIVTEHGGEVSVLSHIGPVPLSKLVTGAKLDTDASMPAFKVSNLFNQLATTRAPLRGWSMFIHPGENALVVTYPTLAGANETEQLVMSLAKPSWSRYRDLPIYSAGVWNREVFFGTADGRVCRSIDYIDNVLLSDPNSFSEVEWSVFGAYQNLGNARNKQVHMIRPTLLSGDISAVIQCIAKYDYDLLEPSAPSGSSSGGGWDTDIWDTAIWGGDYGAAEPLRGAAGMGRAVAIAARGKARSRTVLGGYYVLLEQGGML